MQCRIVLLTSKGPFSAFLDVVDGLQETFLADGAEFQVTDGLHLVPKQLRNAAGEEPEEVLLRAGERGDATGRSMTSRETDRNEETYVQSRREHVRWSVTKKSSDLERVTVAATLARAESQRNRNRVQTSFSTAKRRLSRKRPFRPPMREFIRGKSHALCFIRRVANFINQ